jgi:hypothetical protein
MRTGYVTRRTSAEVYSLSSDLADAIAALPINQYMQLQ